MALPPILCVVGPAGSGKTALLERLIPALRAGGVKAGGVTQCSGDGPADPAGKDAARLARAGARPSIAASPTDLTVQSAAACPPLLDLAAEFCADCDLVLAEGFERSPFDKILLMPSGSSCRPEGGWESVGLVVGDRTGVPPGAVGRDDLGMIVEWTRNWMQRRRRLGRGLMGAILVGGQSRRMGSDKAAMRVGGRPVLPRLAELLATRTDDVWTIGRPVPGVGLPRCVRWHPDLRPGGGPLAGIATALRGASAAGQEAVLAIACDMPRLTLDVVDFLLEGRRPDRPATAIRNPATGYVEPLAAVYETSSLPEIEQALDAGERSVTTVLERLAAHVVEAPAALAEFLANVNRPEELKDIDRR